MLGSMRRWAVTGRRLVPVFVAVAVLALATGLWVDPSSTELAPSNPAWNGLRDAVSEFHLRPLGTLRALPQVPVGSVVVVIPALPLSRDDVDRLGVYLEDGGVVLLLDDSGHANALLVRLGFPARLAGPAVEDPLFSYKNRRFPRITDVMGPASQGVRSLVLNHPTALLHQGPMTAVAQTSLVSYLDTDGNHRLDPGEPPGPFVVAASSPVGMGTLVVVADSSLLEDAMLPLGDNRRFLQNLLGLAGGGAQVYLDTSHLPHAPLDVAKELLQRARDAAAFPPLAFALLAAGILAPYHQLVRRQGGLL